MIWQTWASNNVNKTNCSIFYFHTTILHRCLQCQNIFHWYFQRIGTKFRAASLTSNSFHYTVNWVRVGCVHCWPEWCRTEAAFHHRLDITCTTLIAHMSVMFLPPMDGPLMDFSSTRYGWGEVDVLRRYSTDDGWLSRSVFSWVPSWTPASTIIQWCWWDHFWWPRIRW